MIKDHEDNLKALEADLLAKKANMDDDLTAKLKARKAKKKQAQQKQQQEEMSRLLGEQKKGEEELQKQMQGKELDALKKMWAEGREEEAERLLTLQHRQQTDVLRAQHATNYARAMASVADESKVAEKEEEVKAEQSKEVNDLKERQMKELAEMRGEGGAGGEAAMTDESMLGLKQRLEEEKAARIKAMQMTREQFEKEERAKMEEELKRLEEQMMNDTQKERDELEQKKQSLSERAERRNTSMQEEYRSSASKNQSGQTREEIDSQFRKEAETLTAAINLERAKQDSLLKHKLEARRNARIVEAKAKAQKAFQEGLKNLRSGRQAVADIDLASLDKKDAANARMALAATQLKNLFKSKDPTTNAANKWMMKALGRGLHERDHDDKVSSALARLSSGGIRMERQQSLKSFGLGGRKTYIRSGAAAGNSTLDTSSTAHTPLTARLLTRHNSSIPPSPGGGIDRDKDKDKEVLRAQMEEQRKEIEARQRENEALKEKLKQLEAAPAPAPAPAPPVDPKTPRPPTGLGPTKEEWSDIIKESPLGEKLDQVEDLLRKLLVQTAGGSGAGGAPDDKAKAAPKKKK